MGKFLSPEYRAYINSSEWKRGWRRGLTLWLLFGRDCILPIFPAHDADHVTYRNLTRELPLRDLVPLNRVMHRQIITPLRDLLRSLLGRKLGNRMLAWFLRGCVMFWWGVIFTIVVQIAALIQS